MKSSGINRFQDFFENEKYVALKNYLYNYLLRKRAVEKAMLNENKDVVLEIGSGISPVLTSWDRVVYSDLSFSALRQLRRLQGKGHYVVADGMNLPFKADTFSHTISSEVLEHLKDDRKALREIAGVTKPNGALVVTFPHRHFYYSHDDRFVNHYRRYELLEMASRLKDAGLHPVFVRKVLGPLEKITMLMVTVCISMLQGVGGKKRTSEQPSKPSGMLIFFFKWANSLFAGLAWIDALIVPRALSAVLLIKAVRRGGL
jgi:ubiquinone/menaquinone biosynthesis C-methylase UbiE